MHGGRESMSSTMIKKKSHCLSLFITTHLNEALEMKRARMARVSKNLIILHEKIWPNVEIATKAKIEKLSWEVLYRPAYSPDLAL